MKNRPVGDELLHADRRSDMTKLTVKCSNFANVANIGQSNPILRLNISDSLFNGQ